MDTELTATTARAVTFVADAGATIVTLPAGTLVTVSAAAFESDRRTVRARVAGRPWLTQAVYRPTLIPA